MAKSALHNLFLAKGRRGCTARGEPSRTACSEPSRTACGEPSRTAGFTLIETLIVLAVITIVSSYALVFGNVGRRHTALSLEVQKIAEFVLRAKSLTILTFSMPLSSCGFGVEVNYQDQTYSLFSYATSTGQPNCADVTAINSSNKQYVPGERQKVSAGVQLVGNSPDSLSSVLFVPPAPLTIISSNSGGLAPAKIYLETVDNVPEKAYREIFISAAGQVDF